MGVLSGIQTRCNTALRNLGQSSDRVSPVGRLQPAIVRSILQRAVDIVKPRIQEMFSRKFMASGIHNKSGALASAMRNLKIRLIWKGKKPIVAVSLADGLSAKLYAYAASLNYGAVRQPTMQRVSVDLPSNNAKASVKNMGIIGEKAKKQLKRQVTGEIGQSNRADTWRSGRTNKARMHQVFYDSRRALKTNKSYRVAVMARMKEWTVIGGTPIEQNNKTVGSFVIVPGRKFFSFSPSEKAYIAQLIQSKCEQLAGAN